MSNDPNADKKLHIDEDWKSQVDAEREAAKQQPPQPEPEPSPEQPSARGVWPEPSLALLATTLATQAMSALGFVPHVVTGKTTVDLPQAKHFIDTLAMLEEKTQGNRTADESEVLENILHELRIGYIAVSERSAKP